MRPISSLRALGAGFTVCLALSTVAAAAIDPPTVKATVSDTPRTYANPPVPRFLERLPALPSGHTVKVDLVLLDKTIEIQRGMRYRAWTFNGVIPGPVIHARVGDTIDVTLTNRAAMGHSIDFHAALAPPNVAYQTIEPGKTLHISWVAQYPGAFVYHCGTPPVLAHISNGMYGAIIIDPPESPPPSQSFVFVQSEFYPSAVPGTRDEYAGDMKKMENVFAEVVLFNGRSFQYMERPLAIRVRQKVRVYVVNAGPSHFSAFHVIGTIFEKVLQDGNPQNVQRGIQTMTIPPGGGAIGEFTVYQAGHYPFVTHQFGDADHGAMGAFEAK
jgi:nitrite reductase (NO-forming)